MRGVPEIEGLEAFSLLGEGGFGTVWRARQPSLDRHVAVKVLHQLSGDGAADRRLRREATALGRLSGHPNIVPVHEVGHTVEGSTYLLMPLLPGGSLQDRIDQNGPLPWQEVVALGVLLSGALATAHDAGVLHRDVKPDNVLFDRFGHPQLADFGIARLADASTHTATGGVTATLAYAPPEILDGGDPTPASDVYSLCATLVAAVRGQPAYCDDNPGMAALLARVATADPPDLTEWGAPDELDRLLRRGMAKRPEDRPATPVALGHGLRAVQEARSLPPSPLPHTDADHPRPEAEPSPAPETVASGPPPPAPPVDSTGPDAPAGPQPPAAPPPETLHRPGPPDRGATEPARPRASEPNRTMLVAGLVAVVLLVGGVVGWNLVTSDRGDTGHPSTAVSAVEDPTTAEQLGGGAAAEGEDALEEVDDGPPVEDESAQQASDPPAPDDAGLLTLPTVSHILVESEAEARQVRDELAGGASFAELAAQRSIDPGSAAAGGWVGPLVPGLFVPEFEQAAEALGDGEVSEPVETDFGWHVIRRAPPLAGTEVQVLDGTGDPAGLEDAVAWLEAHRLVLIDGGRAASDHAETTIFHSPGAEGLAVTLSRIDGRLSAIAPASDLGLDPSVPLHVVVGDDWR